MKQDKPLHFGKRLISQQSGKDSTGRDGHSPGRQRDQGRDAECNRQKHDQNQGTKPDSFMPASLGRFPVRGGGRRVVRYRGYFNRQDSPPKLTFIPARTVKGSAGKPN